VKAFLVLLSGSNRTVSIGTLEILERARHTDAASRTKTIDLIGRGADRDNRSERFIDDESDGILAESGRFMQARRFRGRRRRRLDREKKVKVDLSKELGRGVMEIDIDDTHIYKDRFNVTRRASESRASSSRQFRRVTAAPPPASVSRSISLD